MVRSMGSVVCTFISECLNAEQGGPLNTYQPGISDTERKGKIQFLKHIKRKWLFHVIFYTMPLKKDNAKFPLLGCDALINNPHKFTYVYQ